MYPPLHGGGQGFESPRLHSRKFGYLQVKRKPERRRLKALLSLWHNEPLTEALKRFSEYHGPGAPSFRLTQRSAQISLSIVPRFPAPPRSGSLLTPAPPPPLTALQPRRERLEYHPIQRDPDPRQALAGLRLRRP